MALAKLSNRFWAQSPIFLTLIPHGLKPVAIENKSNLNSFWSSFYCSPKLKNTFTITNSYFFYIFTTPN
jgi:hypothetical protein